MENPKSIRNIFGAILMIAGLAIMVWLVAGRNDAPEVEWSDVNTGTQGDAAVVAEPSLPVSGAIDTTAAQQAKIKADMAKVWPAGLLPAVLFEGRPEIKAAYTFASFQENHEALKAQSCYCGCEATGAHGNLLDCFVKEALPGDKVIFEDHGRYCGSCIGEALDTESGMKEGKSSDEIKALIDSKYGHL